MKTTPPFCLKAGTHIIPMHRVVRVETDRLESELTLVLVLDQGERIEAHGIDAVENVLLLKPSIVEGRRFRFAKRSWIIHNLIGHPLMQLLALVGLTKLAMRVHDATTPGILDRHPKYKHPTS